MFIEQLIKLLELSVEKNGNKPLTNSHLLFIIKLARSRANNEQELMDKYLMTLGSDID